MFFRDFTEEQLSDVISCIIGGEKFKAVSLYRQLDKDSSSEDVISRVIEVAGKIPEWCKDKDFAMRHIPSICCLKCTGRNCGRWKEKTKDGGFDTSRCCFAGLGFRDFESVDDFVKKNTGNQITIVVSRDESKNLRHEIQFKVEKKIFSVSSNIYNYRQKRLVKTKKRVFIGLNNIPLEHVVGKMRHGFQILSNIEVPDTLTINGRDPKKSEKTYRDYFNNCQEEIRKKNAKVQKEVYKMSFEDACSEFIKVCTPSERSIISSIGGDVKSYLRQFYNGMSVWQVLEQIKSI